MASCDDIYNLDTLDLGGESSDAERYISAAQVSQLVTSQM